MNLYDYFKSLNKDERNEFAKNADTSPAYLTSHIMKPRPKKIKGASVQYMQRLANASNGKVCFQEVVSHFLDREIYTGSDQAA